MRTIEICKLTVVSIHDVPGFRVLKVLLPSCPCLEGDLRNLECRANELIHRLTDTDNPTSRDMYLVCVIACVCQMRTPASVLPDDLSYAEMIVLR